MDIKGMGRITLISIYIHILSTYLNGLRPLLVPTKSLRQAIKSKKELVKNIFYITV